MYHESSAQDGLPLQVTVATPGGDVDIVWCNETTEVIAHRAHELAPPRRAEVASGGDGNDGNDDGDDDERRADESMDAYVARLRSALAAARDGCSSPPSKRARS
jgi:hypothetical protein